MHHTSKTGAIIQARAKRNADAGNTVTVSHHWEITARDPAGRIKWTDEIDNLVTTAGLNKYLDSTIKTGVSSPTWYIGLTDGTPSAAAGDTMASHAGWTEVTAYDEANRVEYQEGTISSGSVDNSGNTATFTISANSTTVGGAFLVNNNTKGGSTGDLLAVGAFTAGDKSLDDNDTLDVTLTLSITAS